MGNCEKYLLKRCCGCNSLRTGTIIAGIGAIILSIVTIIIIALNMVGILEIKLRMLIFEDILTQTVIQIIMLVNLCFTIILSILLIIGTIKRNFYMMAPWIILGGMLIIGLLVSVLITAIRYFIAEDNVSGALWLVLGLLTFVIYSYMWYVAFSFFYQIMQETKRGAYTKDPFRRHY